MMWRLDAVIARFSWSRLSWEIDPNAVVFSTAPQSSSDLGFGDSRRDLERREELGLWPLVLFYRFLDGLISP
jgi:hypothetical protein